MTLRPILALAVAAAVAGAVSASADGADSSPAARSSVALTVQCVGVLPVAAGGQQLTPEISRCVPVPG